MTNSIKVLSIRVATFIFSLLLCETFVECKIIGRSNVEVAIKAGFNHDSLLLKIGPGIFPVAVLGSKKMNVESIDSASVTLEGGHGENYFSISPVAMRNIDVISPSYDTGGSVCHQTDQGPDGFLDAIFYFRKNDVLNILDVAAADTGEAVVLRIKGITKGSTRIKVVAEKGRINGFVSNGHRHQNDTHDSRAITDGGSLINNSLLGSSFYGEDCILENMY